jgi:PST family polysaccharide transporter
MSRWQRVTELKAEPGGTPHKSFMSFKTSNAETLPVALTPPGKVSAEPARSGSNTYGHILKSSALIGGSSVLSIALGIVRTKAMAILLGPAGMGLLGLYASIADLARVIAGMGINTSGVRQIAEAVGTDNTERIGRTIVTLRRVAILLGALGALLLVVLCQPISKFSFGDHQHAGAIALLALSVFFGSVSAGQLALVQGMRRIGDLARANVLGALCGTLFSIPIVWIWGKQGIVPALVCVAALGSLASWWFSRKIKVQAGTVRLADMSDEVSNLLKFGFVFMASGFLTMGAAYVSRIILLRNIGEAAAGFYQAAWTLGGLYVGFILQAMGADFFPRLTAAASDNKECNRMVNEQTEVGLLLAGPGILGTLTFAPLVIQIFYAASFTPAVEILRWISLGMMLRVASWPMGFILLAKGARRPFFWSEVATLSLQVVMVWALVRPFGVKGAGIAFFGSYVFYWFLIYGIVRSVSGFRWNAVNRRIGLLYLSLVSVAFIGWYLPVPPLFAFAVGTALTCFAGVYSLKRLCALAPLHRLPPAAQRLLVFFRFAPDAERP